MKKSEAVDFEGRHVKWCRCAGKQYCMLSCVWFFATVWTVAPQAPLSIGFSRQEYWSGLPFLPLGDLPIPGIEPVSPASPALQVESLLLNHQGSPKNRIVVPRKVQHRIIMWSSNFTSRYIPQRTESRDCTTVFIVTLFTVVKRWKQPNVHQQINS